MNIPATYHLPLALFVGVIILCSSCTPIDQQSHIGDKVIATVYDKKLYQSDLSNTIPDGLPLKDSLAYSNTFIDRWLKDQVVLIEAEKYIAKDIDVDRLVNDYRSSLLMYNYKKRLIEDQLDTVITDEEYDSFYSREKEQFRLTEPILKYEKFKIKAKSKRLDFFFNDWRNNRVNKVKKYVTAYAEDYVLDTSEYVELHVVLQDLPSKFTGKELKRKKLAQHYADGYEYFVKIIAYIDKGEVAPLSYIKETIRKRILHDRKSVLMARVRKNLYQIALESKKIKRFDMANQQ